MLGFMIPFYIVYFVFSGLSLDLYVWGRCLVVMIVTFLFFFIFL